jgi:hypothetical protein
MYNYVLFNNMMCVNMFYETNKFIHFKLELIKK